MSAAAKGTRRGQWIIPADGCAAGSVGTHCGRGILFHRQLWSPSPWTSFCVCAHGDGGVCVTSCPGGHEPQCRGCGGLRTAGRRHNHIFHYLNESIRFNELLCPRGSFNRAAFKRKRKKKQTPPPNAQDISLKAMRAQDRYTLWDKY